MGPDSNLLQAPTEFPNMWTAKELRLDDRLFNAGMLAAMPSRTSTNNAAWRKPSG